MSCQTHRQANGSVAARSTGVFLQDTVSTIISTIGKVKYVIPISCHQAIAYAYGKHGLSLNFEDNDPKQSDFSGACIFDETSSLP